MVKKFLYRVQRNQHEYDGTASVNPPDTASPFLLQMNDILHQHLVHFKNKITQYHKNKKWDRFKKLTNDYELVFTTSVGFPSIASYNPISRSYFKLWEILQDLGTVEMGLKGSDTPKRAAFLADAPGGFIEAFVNYRHAPSDSLFAISLKATNRIIPQWKFDSNYCLAHNITLCYGEKGTGDLYDLEIIHNFVATVGESSCDLVTADGGFDFSSNFNNQEEMSTRLVLCEVYAALCLQARNGSLVLKIFDIHNDVTIRILHLLSTFYNTMYFVKPLSSRPANSEKYVVCTGFQGGSPHYVAALANAITQLRCRPLNMVAPLATLKPSPSFLAAVVEFNHIYIMCQVMHICETLRMIDSPVVCDSESIIRKQVKKAIKWCHKYAVPVSLEALKRYKPYYVSPPPVLG
jgi:hypothetical protein